MFKSVALACLVSSISLAQTPAGPALSVDAAADRHPISPGVYGINFYWDKAETDSSLARTAPDLRATARRWGGNNTSRYNWKLDISNIDADWFFEVLPDFSVDASRLPEGSSFNKMMERTRTTGGMMIGTIPILGWLPGERKEMCSFDVAKYGAQCKVDPYAQYHPMTCGNGVKYDPACGNPSVADGQEPQNKVYIQNDPLDANIRTDEAFQREWIKYLVSKYGRGDQGGVAVWSLDNEPVWWDSTHRDIHPNPFTYDEAFALGLKYAAVIKEADPTALVSGPIGAGWESFFFSKKDIVTGWSTSPWTYFGNPVDRKAHGNIAFVPWYLQQFKAYEDQHGQRLLDILDMHGYITPDGIGFDQAGDTAKEALRLQSTRVFWDPTYTMKTYWVCDTESGGGPVAPRLIPRMREWVSANYPGTRIAITEYNWGAQESITGAVAQADILGIFGREGLDIGTLWAPPRPDQPAAYAFRMFRNYDGIGGAFGETSVQATTGDADKLAIFAAERTDSMLTVLVVNKTAGDLSGTVNLNNFAPGKAAQVWRYSESNLDAIVRDTDAAVSGGNIAATFPKHSMTLFVVPAAISAPKPKVVAVTNAASYQTQIAPGQMVVVWGENLGPKELHGAIQAPNGMVETRMQGVRILFDGVPAPVVYVSEKQCSAVVPYFGASKAVTHVQVEYQAVRSDPLEIAVAPSAPALFTDNMQGTGQAASHNAANGTLTRNSKDNPAAPGSVVVLWATGEGVTDPPGVDGRLAIDILPKPVAQCSVRIGDLPASIEYCGAAPYNMPGLFQINARMDPAVSPGDAVPVSVTVGGSTSQNGVTIAVR